MTSAPKALSASIFLRLFVGRREDALVAFDDGRDHQAHAGVAGRAFDDRAARFQQAGTLGISIIFTAIRSLIELPGLNVSSLASTSASTTPAVSRLIERAVCCRWRRESCGRSGKSSHVDYRTRCPAPVSRRCASYWPFFMALGT